MTEINLYTEARAADYHRYLLASALPAPKAQAWLVYVLLHAEWEKIVATSSEPMVAAIKLAWWREALEEIAAGNAPRAHPLLQALPVDANIPALHEILLMHGEDVERTGFESAEGWLEYHAQMSGKLLALMDAEMPAALGVAWGVVDGLRRLPHALMQGWLPLSEDVLADYSIHDIHAFLHAPDEEKLAPVVEFLARQQLNILEELKVKTRFARHAQVVAMHNAKALLKRRGRVLIHPLKPSHVALPLKLMLTHI